MIFLLGGMEDRSVAVLGIGSLVESVLTRERSYLSDDRAVAPLRHVVRAGIRTLLRITGREGSPASAAGRANQHDELMHRRAPLLFWNVS
tara:strand:- start:191 stop:460 length:270 start_codon:yes stop_codon:yes gene_type:complete